MKTISAVLLSLFAWSTLAEETSMSASSAIKVEIVSDATGYRLLRGGERYTIKGAGIHSGDIERFARHGGNSFRTWTSDAGPKTTALLDRAAALGLSVSLCLELTPERKGFDYDDEEAVSRQARAAREVVLANRDHPALLTWIIGNELNHHFENPRVFDAINDISLMIHELDPNHPTTAALSGFHPEELELLATRAPDLDFLSFQVYGGMVTLPQQIAKAGFTGPFMVTEWGAVGHWEVATTRWGAPIENTSSEKAANYARSYEIALEPFAGQAIGNYVFLWGQKQERTPTWYGMFLETGESTEPVDVMHHIWNGTWPASRAPRISPVRLDGKTAFDNVTLRAGETYTASVDVTDEDDVFYRWELREESRATEVGGDKEEIPPLIPGLIDNPDARQIALTAPAGSGAYRLFVYAYDGQRHAAHANIPFYVE